LAKNKTRATIAFFLAMTIAITSIAYILPVNAANPMVTDETQVFLSVAPNPVGVGQVVTLSMWIYPIPPTSNLRYDGLQVEITHPDGTKETKGPAMGAALGNYFWTFVPADTGTYEIQGSWPGAQFTNISIGGVLTDITRLGDTSPVIELDVQKEPI
jgi:hypothetical protein